MDNSDVVFTWTSTGSLSKDGPATGTLENKQWYKTDPAIWGTSGTVTVSRDEASHVDEGSVHTDTETITISTPPLTSFANHKHVDASSPGDLTAKFKSASSDFYLMDNDGHTGTADIHCCIGLQPSGSLASFGTAGDGLDVIDNDGEKDAVFAVGSGAKIKWVTTINTCGGMPGSYSGCAMTAYHARNAIIKVAASNSTIAHEFGHTEGGLGHVPAPNIMQTPSGAGEFTSTQCSSMF
ncbi:MAG: hypothetical protein K8Q91_03765 [Candidatus Vogelbacteria bacterium]|nr:hypothetical protein [Candidatus Vogelbacteria bacterium]